MTQQIENSGFSFKKECTDCPRLAQITEAVLVDIELATLEDENLAQTLQHIEADIVAIKTIFGQDVNNPDDNDKIVFNRRNAITIGGSVIETMMASCDGYRKPNIFSLGKVCTAAYKPSGYKL